MNKIKLSDLDKRVLVQMANLANNGNKNIGHKDLSELLGVSDPKLFNFCLKKLVRESLLEYKEWKEEQHTYSLERKGLAIALSINEDNKRPKRVVVREKTKHLGIPTTEKEIVVTPAPSSLETGSKTTLDAGINANPISGHGTYSQEDKKIIDFTSEERVSKTKTFEVKRKKKSPKGVDYV